MTTFVSDLFTDTNATALQDHTPDTGGTWAEMAFTAFGIPSTTDAEINTNRCRSLSASGRSRVYRNAADPGDNEYDISLDMTVGTAGIIDDWECYGRMTATGTSDADVDRYQGGYFFHSTDASKKFFLYKIIAGSNTELASAQEDIGTGTFGLKLEVRDAAKKVFLDSTEKLTSADDAITQNGRAGLSCPPNRSNTNYMDNFLAATVVAVAIRGQQLTLLGVS